MGQGKAFREQERGICMVGPEDATDKSGAHCRLKFPLIGCLAFSVQNSTGRLVNRRSEQARPTRVWFACRSGQVRGPDATTASSVTHTRQLKERLDSTTLAGFSSVPLRPSRRVSEMNYIRMDSLTAALQAMVAPSRGSGAAHDLQQLPRTRQEVTLDETSRRAQASASHPRVAPINTTITSAIRKDALGSPLSGRTTLYGDELDEPHEKQQNNGNPQDSKTDLHVDSPNKEDAEWPLKWPIAPQYCRRWGKPESYVILDLSTKLFDGMCG
jgi:hypothetical protein